MHKSNDQDCLAVKGLHGWHVQGRSSGYGPDTSVTYSKGPYQDPPAGCLAIDMSAVYLADEEALSAVNIWKRPGLSLSLPDDNVRSLFEGCIGNDGTTAGHPFDGNLGALTSTDSVGLNVYVAILVAAGGKLVDTTPIYAGCTLCGQRYPAGEHCGCGFYGETK